MLFDYIFLPPISYTQRGWHTLKLWLFTLWQASVSMCVVHSGEYVLQRLVLLSLWWNVIQRERVSCYQKLDYIEGLANSGTERTSYIANHAPLFMVSGHHWKWEQPVAYYLNRGSSKSNLFVLDCTLLPLSVTRVWTMSRPWNWCATRQKPFFKFKDQDIVTVYDPPPLKCTRNLFLKYNVQFEFICSHFPAIS